LENYIKNHGRTPSVGIFRESFPECVLKRVDDVGETVRMVKRKHSRQLMLQAMHKINAALRQEDFLLASKLMSEASLDAQASLLDHTYDGDIFQDFEDIEKEVLARQKKLAETGFSGIPTGFPTLDELTGGIQPGWFVVVAARAGIGKTRNLIRMACAASFSGFSTQYDALEQSRPEIAMQVHAFASSEFGQDVFKSLDLAQGKGYDPKGYRRFLRELSANVQGKMHVADNRRVQINETTIRAQIKRNNPDILFLDYLTLVEGADDWQSTANLTTGLARVGKQSGCAIVTAAQINRSGASAREMGTEHLAATDRLGWDADLLIVVQRFRGCHSVLELSIPKFRHGPDGHRFYLKFDPNQGVMEEITYEQAEELKDQEADKKDEQRAKPKFTPRKKGSFAATAKTRTEAQEPRVSSSKRSDRREVTRRAPRPAERSSAASKRRS
jgi:replicative DNA helicase